MVHDFEPHSARIIEAAIGINKALGTGFLDSITKKPKTATIVSLCRSWRLLTRSMKTAR